VVSGANTGGGVHVHGARDRAWNFTLDGIDKQEGGLVRMRIEPPSSQTVKWSVRFSR
jgi:hypothetical protein